MVKKFSWSFSSLSDYLSCPLKYYETRVTKKFQEPPSPAMMWGTRVHEAFEKAIKDKAPIESDLAPYQTIIDQFMTIPGQVFPERQFAVNRQLQPVPFDSEDAWCRCVTDLFIINGELACAFDWKTGKIKYDFEQLRINALLIFAHFPEVQVIKAAYVWLKDKKVTKETFYRADTKWDKYLASTTFLENSFVNNFWPARKNGLCKQYCPVKTCIHNGQYRGS